jgi:dipeptidyl aminopeptidase/acylaminoacyl peptidase
MIKRLSAVFALLAVILPTAAGHAQNTPPDEIYTALADLSARAGRTLTLSDLSGWRWSRMDYPDSSMGCPKPGLGYMQVITPGYRFVFEYNGATFDYRASVGGGTVFLCSGPDTVPSAPASATAAPTATTPDVTPGPVPQPTESEIAVIYSLPEGNQRPITAGSADQMTRFIELPVNEAITNIAWSGEAIAVTSFTGIRLYNMLALQQPPRLFKVPDGPTYAAAFSPDSSLLVTGHNDTTVRLWDISTGSLRAVLRGHTQPVRAVAFSPNGRLIASAGGSETTGTTETAGITGEDSAIRLWQTDPPVLFTTLEGHTGAVTAVAFSPDGSRLASAGLDHTVRLWDVASGAPGTVLSGYAQPVRAVAFSPDGTWLASAGDEGPIQLREIGPGTQVILDGHVGGVRALAFSPDGTLLVSAGASDHTMRLWDLTTDTLAAALDQGPDAVLSGLAFRVDGMMLAFATSEGERGTVRIWGVAGE